MEFSIWYGIHMLVIHICSVEYIKIKKYASIRDHIKVCQHYRSMPPCLSLDIQMCKVLQNEVLVLA